MRTATSDVFVSVLSMRHANRQIRRGDFDVSEGTGRPNEDTPIVAIVTPRYPPDIGGVERYSSQIAEGLQAGGVMRPLVISTRPGIRTTYSLQNGVQVIRLGSWLTLSNTPLSPLWPIQVHRLLRTWRVSLLNAHSPVPGLADIALAVSGNRPVVITYHSGSMRKGSRLVDLGIGIYERAVLPRIFARADKVVVVSPSVQVTTREDLMMVTPAVDPDVFSFTEPTNEPPVRLLYVGRLDGASNLKGKQVLFDAVARVVPTMPDIELEIVGEGGGRSGWEAEAGDRGVSDRVRFSGTLTGADLVAAYHRASIVVLPSTTEAESFGMCLIEAMSCGRPVIGSRVGGIPFVIEHARDGLLVTPGDPEALAAAIIELGNDPKMRSAMAVRGRHKVESQFSVASLRNAYQSLFADLLS